MNIRFVASAVVTLLLSPCVLCQQIPQVSDEAGLPVRVSADAGVAFKKKLMQRIALEEEAVRKLESRHSTNVELSRNYMQLGLLYQDVAEWNRSETVLEHAVSLVRPEPSEDLAAAMSRLGGLHVLMGKFRQSEKEEQEALKLRLNLGDRLQIARSWNDLAVLYLLRQKYAKARDFAQQAEAEFAIDAQANLADKMSARVALSVALCYLKECPSAIPLLKATLEDVQAKLQPNDFPYGISTFLLGYAYWKSGNMAEAEEYLERGTTLMSAQLGWGHPAYLKALGQYAKFLRENQRLEAANVVEHKIRQAEAVVDVHTLQTGQGVFSFNGPR